MRNALTTKQGRGPFTIRSMLVCFALIAALANALLIAIYPKAILPVFIALIAAVVLLIIGQRPERGLLLAIFLFVVQKSPKLPVVGVFLTFSEVVFVLTILVWLARKASRQHRVELYEPGLLVPFSIYVLVAVVSLLTSFIQADIKTGVAELFARVYLMFFLMLVSSYTTAADRYRRILLAWVTSAILVVSLAGLFLLFRKIGYDPIGLAQDVVLFRGLFLFSTGLAGYVSGTFLGFLPLALSRQPTTVFRRIQALARWSLPGLLLALVLANSQGAYLATLVGVLAWPFIRLSKSLGPILVALVIVVSTIALASALEFQSPDSYISRTLSVIGYDTDRLPLRMALMKTRFQMIADHPIIGVGLGQAGKYTDYLTGRNESVGSHFTPVGILVETGVLGLLAVSVIMIAFLRIMKENTTLNLDRDSGWLQLNEGLTVAFIGMYVFGLAHDIQTNRTMWLILALIVGLKPASLATTSRLSKANQVSDLLPVDTETNTRQPKPYTTARHCQPRGQDDAGASCNNSL
jgi:O-antigen ligase